MTAQTPVSASRKTGVSNCTFCGALVFYSVAEIGPGPFTEHVYDDGAGSDHLATWCLACGPRHRAGR